MPSTESTVFAREEPCPPAFSRVSQRLGASIVRHVMRLGYYELVRALEWLRLIRRRLKPKSILQLH
jgi:hypothetical protein